MNTRLSLSPSQSEGYARFVSFLSGSCEVMLLRGSAGTGKTTLVRQLIEHLCAQHRCVAPVAPTGRAARILSERTGHPASTVHGCIYNFKDVEVHEEASGPNDPGHRFIFPLKTDDPDNVVFIVDESSMLGDRRTESDVMQFGSGRLLSDLIRYARVGRPDREPGQRCRIVFVGDPAQLPPVGETLSPALSADYLKTTFGLDCVEFELTDVLRQAAGSAILDRATQIRADISRGVFTRLQVAPAAGEIEPVSVTQAVAIAVDALGEQRSTVFVTHTNAQARELNRAVRGRLWGDEDGPVRLDDLLLVNKNSLKHPFMNGDLVRVVELGDAPDVRPVHIRGVEDTVHLRYQRVWLTQHPRRDGETALVTECLLLLNLLDSPSRELSATEQRAMLVDFRMRHPGLKPGTAAFGAALRADPCFNALQVKYGYAMTCHKAQGGEWDTAIVNFPDRSGHHREAYFRWVYTAITRARRTLHTIGAPRFDAYSGMNWGVRLAPAPPPVPPAPPTLPALPEAAPLPTRPAQPLAPVAAPERDVFGTGLEPLRQHFAQLQPALQAQGIRIDRVEHLQYCERYHLSRPGVQAAVQYFYKASFKVSTVGVASAAGSDAELAAQGVATLRQVLLLGAVAAAAAGPLPSAFLQAFRHKLEDALAGADVRLLSAEPLSYRLRCTLQQRSSQLQARLDFHYDGQERWTRVEEVGGPGSSRGLLDLVRNALEVTC